MEDHLQILLDARPDPVAQFADLLSVEPDLPLIRPVQPQKGLAAARLAHFF